MNPDLETLIEELKQIKENDSQFKLTHSEIISFLRAFIAAIEDPTIFLNPFSEFTYDEKNKVILHLNLIRAYGINHVTRSRMAAKAISIIEDARGAGSGEPRYPVGMSASSSLRQSKIVESAEPIEAKKNSGYPE